MQTIDDTDDRIKYGSSWIKGGVDGEHNHTTHGVNGTGCTETLQFNGTAILVYGTIAAGVGKFVSNYRLDGGSEISNLSTEVGQPQYHQLFYNSTDLEDMPHTLVIGAGLGFWLDYIQILSSNLSNAEHSKSLAPSTPQPSSRTTINTMSVQMTTSHENFPAPSTSISNTVAKQHTDEGPIAGSVVGVILLTLIAALIVWRRRRMNRYQKDLEAIMSELTRGAIFSNGDAQRPTSAAPPSTLGTDSIDPSAFAGSSETPDNNATSIGESARTVHVQEDRWHDLPPAPSMPQSLGQPVDPGPVRTYFGNFDKVRAASFSTQSTGPPPYTP